VPAATGLATYIFMLLPRATTRLAITAITQAARNMW